MRYPERHESAETRGPGRATLLSAANGLGAGPTTAELAKPGPLQPALASPALTAPCTQLSRRNCALLWTQDGWGRALEGGAAQGRSAPPHRTLAAPSARMGKEAPALSPSGVRPQGGGGPAHGRAWGTCQDHPLLL